MYFVHFPPLKHLMHLAEVLALEASVRIEPFRGIFVQSLCHLLIPTLWLNLSINLDLIYLFGLCFSK